MPRHIRKGDEVMIRNGDFRGKTGTVVRILTKKDRVVVKGPQIQGITKNLRPTRVNPQAGQVTLDRTFHVSNVSPVVDGKATRVRFDVKGDGSKVRVAVLAGKSLKELGVVRGAGARPTRAPKPAKSPRTRTKKEAGARA